MVCKILPPSTFILQGSSVFWSSSDQVNYLGYTTRKNRLRNPKSFKDSSKFQETYMRKLRHVITIIRTYIIITLEPIRFLFMCLCECLHSPVLVYILLCIYVYI